MRSMADSASTLSSRTPTHSPSRSSGIACRETSASAAASLRRWMRWARVACTMRWTAGSFGTAWLGDWTRPSSEKMLDGNAALLRVYLRAWETFGHAPYRAKAIDILRYVHGTLADPVDGGFFASQRADEQYYALRVAGRPPRGSGTTRGSLLVRRYETRRW